MDFFDSAIPDDLIRMIRERRVIPFVGAGFAAALGLPSWDHLLKSIAAVMAQQSDFDQAIDFDEIKKHCDNDYLRIAEYFFIKSGNHIGPIRQTISSELQKANANPAKSTAHIELVNLGAPQIYTTNYDDLIERTYQNLKTPYRVVALPKDVAGSGGKSTQIVKYHGDLQYENTLVLTESSYYRRLEFDSPMDLKFRSDLLGRSVLFMGYSFRDVNIRIIWFKLMQMMEEVPLDQRTKSYIVMLHNNPILEVLYKSVGLDAIILDPNGTTKDVSEKYALLGGFLAELGRRASANGAIPGGDALMFASEGFLSSLWHELERIRPQARSRGVPFRRQSPARLDLLTDQLSHRRYPDALCDSLSSLISDLAHFRVTPELILVALRYLETFGPSEVVTFCVALGLASAGPRKVLLEADLAWNKAWGEKLTAKDAAIVAERLYGWTLYGTVDEDWPFAVDVLARIANGEISDEHDMRARARRAIAKASKRMRMAIVRKHAPIKGSKPNVSKLIRKKRSQQSPDIVITS